MIYLTRQPETQVEPKFNVEKLVNPCKEIKAQRTERRASERIQKTILTGAGMSQEISSNKRNLEGNSCPPPNSFSALDNDELIAKMILLP